MEEKCRSCGGTLFNKVLLDDEGHWAMDQETPLNLEHEEGDYFYKCPHCSAKNVVVDSTGTGDIPQHGISHIKNEGVRKRNPP